jgi:pyrroloquinoline quinone biosynthesis protein B
MKIRFFYIFGMLLLLSCENELELKSDQKERSTDQVSTSILLLGNLQDAGSPHIGCKKDCCKDLFENPDPNRQVISLGLFDASTNLKYLFEATPDISRQLKRLKNYGVKNEIEMPEAIFLTHAHIGHYAGLMYLGKEATNANLVKVFALPRMKSFLEKNGPWGQLVNNKNIDLQALTANQSVVLSKNLKVTPLLVPHRDEYSETVGYLIEGPKKSALFIPDIDKWEKWEIDIMEQIKKVDYAFLDATFYSGKEINNRDISEIPHPFIIESIEKFEKLSSDEKKKVVFIHFNHTNPVLDPNSAESKWVIKNGFRIGRLGDIFQL